MISIERSAGRLIAAVHNAGQTKRITLTPLLALSADWEKLTKPVARHLNTQRPDSQVTSLRYFLILAQALAAGRYKCLPSSESGWQDLVMHAFEFCLTGAGYKRSFITRVRSWNHGVAVILRMLRDVEDVIPLAVEIPSIPEALATSDELVQHDRLIGDRPPSVVQRDITKLLISISLARSDAEYLDEVRDQLSYRRRILHECLLEWWQQVHAHYQYGQRLIGQTNWKKLRRMLDFNEHRKGHGGRRGRTGNPHVANGRTEESLGNLLAILTYEHGSLLKKDVLASTKRLPDLKTIKFPSTAPAAAPIASKTMRLNWMLGNLSQMDIAVCMALLTMHTPKWTSQALASAKLVDKNGKPYLEFEGRDKFFRLDKPRANKMKEGHLDDTAYDILRSLISMTSAHRLALQKQKAAWSNNLFISATKGILSPPNPLVIYKLLSGERGRQVVEQARDLYTCMPRLAAAGITRGTVTLRKIRATEGVLEWFRTGSVAAMATKLGNSSRVVLEHYLPQPLLVKWNTRIVRRFQNLWLIVAAGGGNDNLLLEISDFQTLSQLHTFIADMLSHHPNGSSPLSDSLHAAFGRLAERTPLISDPRRSLAVSVSEQSLAAIYLYQESAIESGAPPDVLDRRDSANGLSPRQFIALAELLRSELPKSREPAMRVAHVAALRAVENLRHSVKWNDLFVTVDRAHSV